MVRTTKHPNGDALLNLDHIEIRVYSGDVRSVFLRVVGDFPLKVGEQVTLEISGITREVTER